MIDYWPLLGIALVVIGFALRFNPLLVVAVAAIVTGLLGHMPFLKVLGTLGHGFNVEVPEDSQAGMSAALEQGALSVMKVLVPLRVTPTSRDAWLLNFGRKRSRLTLSKL